MKKILIGIGILVILIIAVVFTVSKTKIAPNEIKIGVLTSLTGASAKYGQSALNGIQMATNEINGKGGIKGKKINLIIEDDGSDTSRAVSAFRKLISINKVPVIIGPISSSAAMACSPIANDSKVVLFSPAAATPAFTSPNDYTFRNRVSSEYEISELARFVYQKLLLRRIAILYVNNDWGIGARNSFENKTKELGGSITISETFSEGDNDMRTQLTKIKGEKPDGILIIGQGTEGGYAIRQVVELGLKTQLLSVLSIQRSDIIDIAGKAADGVIYTAPMYDPSLSQSIFEFNIKYLQLYKEESDIFSGNGYDAVNIVVQAIEKAGYSAAGIMKTLLGVKEFPGVTGSTTFDLNGDVYKPISVKIIRDGKFQYYDKAE